MIHDYSFVDSFVVINFYYHIISLLLRNPFLSYFITVTVLIVLFFFVEIKTHQVDFNLKIGSPVECNGLGRFECLQEFLSFIYFYHILLRKGSFIHLENNINIKVKHSKSHWLFLGLHYYHFFPFIILFWKMIFGLFCFDFGWKFKRKIESYLLVVKIV